MPLINLQTNLKSFKYGHDRPGGGDSGQPFITTDINTGATSASVGSRNILRLFGIRSIPGVPNLDTILNRSRIGRITNEILSGDEFIRGGALGAAQAALNDTLRIGTFFLTVPKGPLFIAKQVGLQLSNPRLEVKKGVRGAASGAFNPGGLLGTLTGGILGPTRIYNLGINTIAQIPVNAFGGHFYRHGILPVQDDNTKYEAVVTFNNNSSNSQQNRLVGLTSKFKLGDRQFEASRIFNLRQARRDNRQNNRAVRRNIRALNQVVREFTGQRNFIKFKRNKVDTTSLTIDSYLGGPDSVYGVGRTIIKRYQFTEDKAKIDEAYVNALMFSGLTRDDKNNPTPIKIGNTADYKISTLTDSTLAPNFFDLSASIGLNPDVADLSSTVPANFTNDPKNIPVNYFGSLGVSTQYFGTGTGLTGSGINPTLPTQKPTFLDQATYAGRAFDASGKPAITTYNIATKQFTPATPPATNIPSANASYTAYQSIINSKRLTQQPIDIISGSASIPANQFGILATDPTTGKTLPSRGYSTTALPGGKIAYSNSYGDVVIIKTKSWDAVSREVRVGSGRKDTINLTPIFSESATFGNDLIQIGGKRGIPYNIRDLVRFRIQAVDTDSPDRGNWMVFRAYLTDLSDDTNADWSDIKYAGRGDKFYIYTGFNRKINISFKIATLSVDEMKFVYNKLNYLMSNTMPDYKGNIMRGPLIRMSVGNWIDTQLGILNNISLKVPQDSPWEINLDGPEGGTQRLVLPHVVEVSLSFTPIGSESKGKNRLSQKSKTISNIAQNNTGVLTSQYVD